MTSKILFQHFSSRRLIVATITICLLLASSANALNIVGIAIDSREIPFLLDDEGHVWTFRKPITFELPIRLPNLNHIKQIAPYIALDDKGRVFTWSLNVIKTDWGPYGLNEAAFNAPTQINDLRDATLIASSDDSYFVAVIGKQDIVDWQAIRDKSGVVTNGKVKKVLSRIGVKAVAAYWSPALVSKENAVISPSEASLVALYEDGDILGFGIGAYGVSEGHDHRKTILLTKVPGATNISMSRAHTVVLTEDGVPKFWGVCGRSAASVSLMGNTRKVLGVDGYVRNVKAISLFQGDDNILMDVFITRDGSAWAAHAPAPEGPDSPFCPQDANREHSWKLSENSVVATQIATSGEVILMLDTNHKLWATRVDVYKTPLKQVRINLR